MKAFSEDQMREIVSQSVFDASKRLAYDHELEVITEEEIRRRANIDYNNELNKLVSKSINDKSPILKEYIKTYINNKEDIINKRIKRTMYKKDVIATRDSKTWSNIEEIYRNEELENCKFLRTNNLKRANYNDIRLIRNFIRTVGIFNPTTSLRRITNDK